MAVGARGGSVVHSVVLEGARLVVLGLVVGFGLAFALRGAVEGYLVGVSLMDPVTVLAVPTILLTVGVIACLVPALRATSVDPLSVLRPD